jgi:multidrug resistance efflux pump
MEHAGRSGGHLDKLDNDLLGLALALAERRIRCAERDLEGMRRVRDELQAELKRRNAQQAAA